jgi:SNF2 family DNA or RNA helicase
MNKDEILSKIIQTEEKIRESKDNHDKLSEQVKERKTVVEKQQKVYDEVRAQLEAIAEVLRDSKDLFTARRSELYKSQEEQASFSEELRKLRRELSRLEDAERIHKEYQDQVEAFKEKCLLAPWRKENRTDGKGALEHQVDGAIHMAVARQGLLGDKRGLGKSLTGLIYADLLESQKAIVVCPSDTMDNFIAEIKLWAPHRNVIKLGKMSKAERDFTLPILTSQPQYILVFNYEAWRRDPEFIPDIVNLKADTLIYDEAHMAKTMSTQACQGIMDMRFGLNTCPSCRSDNPEVEVMGFFGENRNYAKCNSCGHEAFITEFCSIKNVLPMTGSPILNKPQELFPHLRMIDPKNFIDEKTYLVDFCRKTYDGKWVWAYNGEKQLMEKIGPRYLARDRKAAGIIIPPAQPVEHIITMDEFKEGYPKQFKAYQQVRDYAQLVMDPERGIAMAMPYMIVVLMRLRQVLTWPAGIELVIKERDEATGEEIEIERINLNVYESVKIDKAIEIIKEVNEEGDAALGFSQFKDPIYEMGRRLGKRTALYTGRISDYEKRRMQLDFDPKTAPPNPQWDNLLGTYKAMGTGLNLNRATHAVMLDREWNPGKEDQAEGRIDRLGTTKDTYIHRIMVEGTIDTWMKKLIDQKAELIGGFSTQADLFNEVYRALREGEI